MKILRIYVDTSVIGGCCDQQFSKESKALLEMARSGKAVLLVSPLLLAELALAPLELQNYLNQMPTECLESVLMTEEAERLRDAYLDANVVGRKHSHDAHHVAMATVVRADMIVSRNFTHIVHFDKIRGFNSANLKEGYSPIEIWSPKEVI